MLNNIQIIHVIDWMRASAGVEIKTPNGWRELIEIKDIIYEKCDNPHKPYVCEGGEYGYDEVDDVRPIDPQFII